MIGVIRKVYGGTERSNMIIYGRICQKGAASITKLESRRANPNHTISMQFLLNHLIAVRIGNGALFQQVWGISVGGCMNK